MAKSKAERNTRAYEKQDPKAKSLKKARNKVSNAVRDGRMKKPTKCPKCGKSEGEVRIEYDHNTKPPGWSCSQCNKRGNAIPRRG